MAFNALATLLVPLAVMRMRMRAPRPRAMVDWSAFSDAPFLVFTLSLLIVFIGNSVLIFYISFFPAHRGIINTSLALYIVAIFDAASIPGRIVPNALFDHIGVFNTMAPITLVLAATVLCMLAVHNAAGMVIEAVVTGFFSGVVFAMPPVCFAMLTKKKSMIGTSIGQDFAMGGLGLLIGGPIAGAILGSVEPLNWSRLWAFGGVAVCTSGLIILVAGVIKAGVVLKAKA